jgi:type I restriction enzyme, S subunit
MNQNRASTTTNSQLKEGYKQTEVGVIPEDWSATNLGRFMMLQRGYDLPHRERKIGDIPIITSSGFGGTHSESRALAPGVVTGRYGTIGDVFYVQEDFWPLNTTLYVKNFYGNNPLFASYLLKTIDFHSHSGKSGVPGVNRNDLHELIVRIPPLSEQEAIASTLSDIDALIESLDRLLTKKRQIKQGAMQELLRSKEGWVENKLEDIADVIDPHPSHRAPAEVPNGIPFVGIGDIGKNGEFIGSKVRTVDPKVFDEHQKRYSLDDELIGLGRVASIGKVVKIKKNTSKYVISPTLGIIRGTTVKRSYLLYALNSKAVTDQFVKIMSGSTRSSVGMIVLRRLNIVMPIEEEERNRIANILSDMDAEIDSISAKLTKTRQLKQGMMHELLTGRIRLVDL